MATDATGTPTSLGIPKFNTSADSPSGLGTNAMMDSIDALIVQTPRSGAIAGIAVGSVPVWNGTAWVKPTGTPDGTKFLRDDGAWTAVSGAASVTPVSLTTPDSSGNAFHVPVSLTDWVAGHWEFAANVDGKVYGNVLVPDGVTSATLRLVVGANATTGITRLNIATAAVADTESLNPAALTNGTAQDITVPATAYLRKDVTFSLTGLAGSDFLIVEVFHEGAHGNDTLSAATLLFGAWLEPA